MIFDTDIFIWIQRGHSKAFSLVEQTEERFLSLQTYLELLQGAKNKQQHQIIKQFLNDFGFITLPLTENIGHRALIYLEEYTLKSGLMAADAIIAATAVENNLLLASSNQKHFKIIDDLKLQVFKP